MSDEVYRLNGGGRVQARLSALVARRAEALRRGGHPAAQSPAPPARPPEAPPPTPRPGPRSLDPRAAPAAAGGGRFGPLARRLAAQQAASQPPTPKATPAPSRRAASRPASAPAAPTAGDPGEAGDVVQARIEARLAALRAAERQRPSPGAAPVNLGDRLHRLPGATPTPIRQEGRLAAALPGVVQSTPLGPSYCIQTRWPTTHRHGDRPLGDLLARAHAATQLVAEDAAFADFDPRRAVFFDLETTGLSVGQGTLPFLIGAAHWRHDQWVLEQWLLRSPDDEAGALHALAERLAEADWAVSFNGRTYDAPLLATRYQVHGLPDPFEGLRGHLDLLPVSRRLLREGLPNCKLSTLEVAHLGLRRVDDVPGSAVPARYRAYLMGGDPTPLVDVVRHNTDDIASMITLLDLVLERAEAAPSLVLRTPKAALRLARAAERLAPEQARAIYVVAEAVPDTAKAARAGLRRLAAIAARRG